MSPPSSGNRETRRAAGRMQDERTNARKRAAGHDAAPSQPDAWCCGSGPRWSRCRSRSSPSRWTWGRCARLPVPALLRAGACCCSALAAILVAPGRRYRAWGYARGRGRARRSATACWSACAPIVPFGRVQHIDVAQGPIERRVRPRHPDPAHRRHPRRLGAAARPALRRAPRRCATASAPRSARTWCERRPRSEPRRLHPATLIVRWLKIVPQMLAGGIGLGRDRRARAGSGASSCSPAGRRLWPARSFALLSWWRFRYTVGAGRDRDRERLVSRQRRVIPFDRVQDVAIERACSPACSAPPRSGSRPAAPPRTRATST